MQIEQADAFYAFQSHAPKAQQKRSADTQARKKKIHIRKQLCPLLIIYLYIWLKLAWPLILECKW